MTPLARIVTLALLLWSSAASPAATLKPYADEAELARALERWRERAAALYGERRRIEGLSGALTLAQPAPAAAPMAAAKAMTDSVAGAAKEESITNNQTAGVDEGGIVKQAGDYLVVLRRGRLFTVRVGGDRLDAVATTDAYASGVDPRGAWYDELLVSGSTVVVVGYSYARGGTEIGVFDLARDGRLAHRATWHLRSHDYWSSRNYASRLVGRTLVFYTPTLLHPHAPWDQAWPAWRRWSPQALPSDFKRLLPAPQVWRSDDDFDPAEPLALHTVTRCDLGGPELQCSANAVLGPAGRVFYVSSGSVYVWTAPVGWRGRSRPVSPQAASAVFRVPLEGGAPTMLKAAGVPIDQLSFLEDAGGHLNVLLRAGGGGEGMWGAETPAGRLALLRLPLSAFGDGRAVATAQHYRRLPGGEGGVLQNRFIGDWLLWGGTGSSVQMTRYADGAAAQSLAPGHAVERIEALGSHALLVGRRGDDLQFSAVRLGEREATLAGSHVMAGLRQGETRTHGFFHRASGPDAGILGLPVLGARGGSADDGAAVVFLRQRDLVFSALGPLQARRGASARGANDDACKASCVDWYGNARPIFLGDRLFALMGYELVEARLRQPPWPDQRDDERADPRGPERIEERRRIDFSPAPLPRGARHWPFGD